MATEDEPAFHEWLVARLPVLQRFAYLVVGDAAAAEDVLQTALAKVLLAWRRVQRADDPDAYVRRVVVNTERSRRRLRPLRELSAAVLPDRPAGSALNVEDRWGLARALRDLPPRQRAVVVLRYLEDRSEADVATLLGCSPGTVKSQAAKALARLRTHPALDVRGDAPVSGGICGKR